MTLNRLMHWRKKWLSIAKKLEFGTDKFKRAIDNYSALINEINKICEEISEDNRKIDYQRLCLNKSKSNG